MMPVRLELAVPQSRVKHSTNEPLCPVIFILEYEKINCKEFLAIKRAISLNQTFVLFC